MRVEPSPSAVKRGLSIAERSPGGAAAPPAGRPIRDARVAEAIGQPLHRLVPAEAEVFGANGAGRRADRPAAFLRTELEQGASAAVGDRDLFDARLRFA